MARPPQRFGALRTLYTYLVILILIPLGLVGVFFVLPFTFLRYSANWGLRKRDYAPVQLYLDHFEALHPDLISRVSTSLSSSIDTVSSSQGPPKAIKFWPVLRHDDNIGEISSLIIIRLRRYTFSGAAGLFSYLEQCGFRRKDLYAMLKREVESKIPEGSSLTAEDKAHFQRVMSTVCKGNLMSNLNLSSSKQEEGFTLPMSAGEKVIPVRNRSVDWILENPGTMVVPMDMLTYAAMSNLTKALPIWKRVEDDTDLATGLEGKWQMVDLR